MAFNMFGYIPSCINFVDSFYHRWMLNFVDSCLCICLDDLKLLFFSLLLWCITLIELWLLKNPCIPGITCIGLCNYPVNVLFLIVAFSFPFGEGPLAVVAKVVSWCFNYLFEGLSKYSLILRCWGLELQHMNLGGDTTQLITVSLT